MADNETFSGGGVNDHVLRMLLSGERILWQGKPCNGLILRPIELFLIPFSLLWAGFAVFWNVGVWTSGINGPDLSFKLFGIPFLIAGLYITFGRFLLDIFIRRRLTYVVTDHRILICRKTRGCASKSLDIKRLPCIELDERANGTGTIRFGEAASWFGGRNYGIWQPTFEATPQFLRIDQVRAVYDLIQKQAAR